MKMTRVYTISLSGSAKCVGWRKDPDLAVAWALLAMGLCKPDIIAIEVRYPDGVVRRVPRPQNDSEDGRGLRLRREHFAQLPGVIKDALIKRCYQRLAQKFAHEHSDLAGAGDPDGAAHATEPVPEGETRECRRCHVRPDGKVACVRRGICGTWIAANVTPGVWHRNPRIKSPALPVAEDRDTVQAALDAYADTQRGWHAWTPPDGVRCADV